MFAQTSLKLWQLYYTGGTEDHKADHGVDDEHRIV